MIEQINGLTARIDEYDWEKVNSELDRFGTATLKNIISPQICRKIASLYPNSAIFRTTISMERHGFGSGEYRYFANPLPDLVQVLRQALYSHLAVVANRWSDRLGHQPHGRRDGDPRNRVTYPPIHDGFLKQCHEAGQTRPTPLLLRYVEGDYNCLHQDLNGDLAFPLQVAILLSKPGEDFTGGEFVLTEQRPRMQSRAEVVPLGQGDAVIFAVNDRPVRGVRGDYRVKMRHGVSRVRSGMRHTLGIIFHDSR